MANIFDILKNLGSQSSALGPGGPGGLRFLVEKYFLPRLTGQEAAGGKISDAFLGQVTTPGADFGEAQKAAEGYAGQLFAPGGQVASMIQQVRGGAIQRGFDPSAAEGGERGVLQQATGQVGNFFAQQAGQLEAQRLGAITSTYQSQNQMINDLLESLYTGVAGAEQLKLAKNPPRQKFLGIF